MAERTFKRKSKRNLRNLQKETLKWNLMELQKGSLKGNLTRGTYLRPFKFGEHRVGRARETFGGD